MADDRDDSGSGAKILRFPVERVRAPVDADVPLPPDGGDMPAGSEGGDVPSGSEDGDVPAASETGGVVAGSEGAEAPDGGGSILRRSESEATRAVVLAAGRAPQRSFESLFVREWPHIRRRLAEAEGPGVVVLAFDGHRGFPVGDAWVPVTGGRPGHAVVGRHEWADLVLPDDPDVSLRHLAVVAEPSEPRFDGWSADDGAPAAGDARTASLAPRVRALDLRSRIGFEDEWAEPRTSLHADGPLLLRVGAYALFCLPVPGPDPWADDARAAWASLPPRRILDDEDEDEEGPPAPGAEVTRISVIGSPLTPDEVARPSGERVLGLLVIEAGERRDTLEIGEWAAERGVLVGRYERCEGEGVLGDDVQISRVHALVLRVGEGLWVLDAASTNGISLAGSEADARIIPLDWGTEVLLGDDRAVLTWRPAGGRPGPCALV